MVSEWILKTLKGQFSGCRERYHYYVGGRQQGLEFMSVHRLPPLAATPNAGFPELADGALEAVVVIPQATRFGRRPAAWHVAAPHVEREHLPARSGRKVGGSSQRRG